MKQLKYTYSEEHGLECKLPEEYGSLIKKHFMQDSKPIDSYTSGKIREDIRKLSEIWSDIGDAMFVLNEANVSIDSQLEKAVNSMTSETPDKSYIHSLESAYLSYKFLKDLEKEVGSALINELSGEFLLEEINKRKASSSHKKGIEITYELYNSNYDGTYFRIYFTLKRKRLENKEFSAAVSTDIKAHPNMSPLAGI